MEDIKNSAGLTEEEFLKQYKPSDYERPSVTVDMLILCMNKCLENLKVLFIQRKDHPYINQWALAGGFVGIKESTYEAAVRELKEETGLENIYLEQLYTMSQPDRDPRMRVIDVAYIALIQEQGVKAGDDAKDALWFDITTFNNEKLILQNKEKNITIEYNLTKKTFKNGVINIEGFVPVHCNGEKLAFDHAEIILEGLLRIRNKVLYSDIAFNLLPEVFTMPDIKQVYEVILGKQLYKANFKAHIEEKLNALDYKISSSTKNGKFSQAYSYKGEK